MSGHVRRLYALSDSAIEIQNRYTVQMPKVHIYWRHMANTIQPSVCGGDAVFCQITLIFDTLLYYISWERKGYTRRIRGLLLAFVGLYRPTVL